MPAIDLVAENVPPFVRRVGDRVIRGSNNTLIVLGTDRAAAGPASVSDGLGHTGANGKGVGTGTIHIIAGVKDKNGNPDVVSDDAFLYVSRKTDVDQNAGFDQIQGKDSGPTVLAKSDLVRAKFRKNLKISSEDQSVSVFADGSQVIVTVGQNVVKVDKDAAHVEVGQSKIDVKKSEIDLNLGTSKLIVKVDGVEVDATVLKIGGNAGVLRGQLLDLFGSLFDSHIHTTAVGPSGPPVPLITPTVISPLKQGTLA